MDLVDSCKDKLTHFRIKELKDVLTQLGLSKQGKKQELVDRLLAILSDERVSAMWAKKSAVGKDAVVKLVNDTYRKMQGSGSADLSSKSKGVSDVMRVKVNHPEEFENSYQMDKVRCFCGHSLATDSMIQCEDPRCNVWQHIECVLIPEKSTDGILPNPPENFYCEICRLSRADPFWVTIAQPLKPVKLNIINVPTDGSNPGQSIEKTFQLTRADKDLLSKQEYDVQVWCMLLNDKVTFRMHWPQYADLQVNGVPVRTVNRPGSQLLGANGRDDGPIVTPCARDGINKISLTGCDSRVFCVGVRIVKRRTMHQILSLIPKESEGEEFEEALARVRRCVGGGATTENADSDSDIELVADFIPFNLRCPMSGLRIKVAGRFKPCVHMGCFDLEVFVEMNQRSRKWQCPICLKNYSWEKVIIDPYFNRITSMMHNSGEDVTEIEIKPDGSWRAKSEGDRKGIGELGLWHLPDGTICASADVESKPNLEIKRIKEETDSDNNPALRLGIKKRQSGCWEFNKRDDLQRLSPASISPENIGNNCQNIIPMSSSATGSGRDGEDVSVNHDGGENCNFPTVNGIGHEAISVNIDTIPGFDKPFTAADGVAELIVLSDSEDEIEQLISSAVVYQNNGSDTGGVSFSAPLNEISDPYCENPALGNGGSSCLDLYNTNDDDFGSNMWPLPSGSQGHNFHLFGPDGEISDPLFDMQRNTLNCSTSGNGYTLTAEVAVASSSTPAPGSTDQQSNMNDGLGDNPLSFSDHDPSLRIFLPTGPSDAPPSQSDWGDHPDISNSIRTEDWISLRLGNGGGVQGVPPGPDELSSGHALLGQSDALASLADHASMMLGMNDNGTKKRSRERSDGPFLFPRQPRSIRRRHIESESE